MTAEDIAGLEEQVAIERSRTLTLRLRLMTLASIGIVLLFLASNPGVRSGSVLPFLTLRLAGLTVLCAFLAVTWLPGFARVQLPAALVLGSGVAALAATGGLLRQDIPTAATLHIILLMLTAASLPWGVGCQLAMVLVCGALELAVVSELGVPVTGDPAILVLINTLAGALLSLFVARQTRYAYDRAVRENLSLRAAEAHNRALNEELEAKVQLRTRELEDALADQRAVARAISHDLRQPLRHIEGYARLVEDDAGELLGSENRERLQRVHTATARMWRMVDSLLVLSRISVRPVERRRIDLSDCAADVRDELVRAEPSREVIVTIAPGLFEDCDGELVRTLLRELFANAWKFTRKREGGTIDFGREPGRGYYVRDNGVGFDLRHAGKLFHAFERLHHAQEFEGEGMGLAICERVVRRHGGRIWARSEPDRGATFYFTLQAEG